MCQKRVEYYWFQESEHWLRVLHAKSENEQDETGSVFKIDAAEARLFWAQKFAGVRLAVWPDG